MSEQRITIGLPVFNGERFIRQSIETILCQTYSHWKLVISDNASTDGTLKICLEYAARDGRISVVRKAKNIGLARNFNSLLLKSATTYFKWQAHDDLCHPTFLEKAVDELDKHQDAVLAYSTSVPIDEFGEVRNDSQYSSDTWNDRINYDCRDPVERSKRFIRHGRPPAPVYLFGLMRTSAAIRTRLMGSYMVADEIFLLEMLFQGGFRHIDEALFFVRNYDDNASALILSGDLAGLQERLDPKLASFVSLQISRYRRYLEYYIGTLRSPMSRSQKAALLSHSTGHTARRLLFIVKRHAQNNAVW